MDDLNQKPDELPVLTEIAVPAAITLAAPSADVVVVQLKVVEPDPGGYDPYNNAPPLPTEKSLY